MSFKPIDGKRDEFRKYLEETGVLDAITKVLIKLMDSPRPENAVEFIQHNLGVSFHQVDTIKELTVDLENARHEIAQLKKTIEQLKANKVQQAQIEAAPGIKAILPAPAQDAAPPAPPTTKEPEEPPAVPETTKTEAPTPTEAVQQAEPGNAEQENKPAATEVSSPPQEGGGN